MPIVIAFDLVGTGWARCSVRPARKTYSMVASSDSDALGDLVLSGHTVLSGFTSSSFEFYGHTTGWLWKVESIAHAQVCIEIVEPTVTITGKFSHNEASIVKFTCHPIEFAKAVCAAARMVLEKNGYGGYKKRWAEHKFPKEMHQLLETRIADMENATS